MKKDVLQGHRNRVRFVLVCMAVFAALVTALLVGQVPASPVPAAQTLGKPWTAIGSTGVVDASIAQELRVRHN